MYGIPLPFADDIRHVGLSNIAAHSSIGLAADADPDIAASVAEAAAAEEAATAAAEIVMKRLEVKKFSCNNFENPVLQVLHVVCIMT